MCWGSVRSIYRRKRCIFGKNFFSLKNFFEMKNIFFDPDWWSIVRIDEGVHQISRIPRFSHLKFPWHYRSIPGHICVTFMQTSSRWLWSRSGMHLLLVVSFMTSCSYPRRVGAVGRKVDWYSQVPLFGLANHEVGCSNTRVELTAI